MRMPHAHEEEITRLREALAAAQAERESMLAEHTTLRNEHAALHSELRVARTERDLLKERLNALMHRLFAASSEARASHQSELFLNEAEALAAANRRKTKRTTTASPSMRTNASSAAGNRSTPLCRAKWCVSNYPKPNASARTTAPR